MVRPRRPALAIVWVLIAAAFAGVSAWVLAGALIPSPYSDAWEWVAGLTAVARGGDPWAWVFQPHNGHLLVWTRGLLLADQAFAGGWNGLFLATGALLLAGLVWALTRVLRREGASAGAIIVVAMIVGFAPNLMNAAVQINAQYVQVMVLAMLALVAQGEAGWRGRVLAVMLGGLACLGNAAALAVWPALALGAVQRRDGRGLALTVAIGGPVTALLLAAQLQAFGGGAAAGQASLAEIANYALAYLGLPVTRASSLAGSCLGALLGAAGLTLILVSLKSPARLIRLAGACAAFSLTTALLAAAGRAAIDGGDIPLRYATFVTPLHLALAFAAADAARRGPPALPA
ncbi:MAG: hypothetical protein IT546_02585, partial [Caulobacteraceae bacterium]|nr:hypothetical protein [Caulobacteraceae bacterium]